MILLNEIKKINIKSIYKSLGGFGDSEANIYAVDNCFFMEYSIKSRLINESGKMQMGSESIQKLLDYLGEPKVNKNEFLNIQTINKWSIPVSKKNDLWKNRYPTVQYEVCWSTASEGTNQIYGG